MSRIDLTDNFMSSVVKLAEGNPGACVAAMEMSKASPLVDPDSALGPFGPLLRTWAVKTEEQHSRSLAPNPQGTR